MVDVNLVNNKHYESKDSSSISHELPTPVLKEIQRLAGIPEKVGALLDSTAPNMLYTLIKTQYKKYFGDVIHYILDSNDDIVGISTSTSVPVLNSDFISEVLKSIELYQDKLEILEICYDKNNLESSILLMNKEVIEDDSDSYRVGVLISNDERSTVNCRLAVSVNDIIFYLPSRCYNLSSARYFRSSDNSTDAMKVLLLRVVEEMISEEWNKRYNDIKLQIQIIKKLPVSYEEIKQLSSTLKNAALSSDLSEQEVSDIENNLEEFIAPIENEYPQFSQKKGSYLWRCSALSDYNVYSTLEYFYDYLESGSWYFYPESKKELRLLFGEFLMNERVVSNLAKRKE